MSKKRTTVEKDFLEYLNQLSYTASLSTYRQTKYLALRWIIPFIGDKLTASLCDGDIQYILDCAAAQQKSKKTVRNIKGAISRFLHWCRRYQKTSYKMDDVIVPVSARYQGKAILQPDDIYKLMTIDTTVLGGAVVKEPYIYAYRFQLLTGMRPGEIHGMRIEDVVGDKVYIKRSINVYGESTKGKNENAVRSFVMPLMAQKVLEKQLREHPSEDGFIFNITTQCNYLKHWHRYCEVNKITKTTTYELRHTFVSIVKTMPEGEIKQLVGHSTDMDTFGIYSHEILGEDVCVAKKVNELFDFLLKKQINRQNLIL